MTGVPRPHREGETRRSNYLSCFCWCVIKFDASLRVLAARQSRRTWIALRSRVRCCYLRSVWAENSWKINVVFVEDTWDGSLTPCGFRLGSHTSHKRCFMTPVSWKTVESSPANEKLLSQTTIKIISATHVCRENDILAVWSRNGTENNLQPKKSSLKYAFFFFPFSLCRVCTCV